MSDPYMSDPYMRSAIHEQIHIWHPFTPDKFIHPILVMTGCPMGEPRIVEAQATLKLPDEVDTCSVDGTMEQMATADIKMMNKE